MNEVEELAIERVRIEAAIESARRRRDLATRRAHDQEAAARLEMRELIETSQRMLADMDRAHRSAIEVVRQTARAEADAILAAAARDGERVHEIGPRPGDQAPREP